MNMECDNCGKKFRDMSEFKHVFPYIPDLLKRIGPGGTVPCAECPHCGALVYEAHDDDLECGICGDMVEPDKLRDHLVEHNPNALSMEWEDVRNVFREKSIEEDDEAKPLVCPECGSQRMAQIDLIPGYAHIQGVKPDGTIEWAGETEVDWDNQRPASNPPEFVCLACNEK